MHGADPDRQPDLPPLEIVEARRRFATAASVPPRGSGAIPTISSCRTTASPCPPPPRNCLTATAASRRARSSGRFPTRVAAATSSRVSGPSPTRAAGPASARRRRRGGPAGLQGGPGAPGHRRPVRAARLPRRPRRQLCCPARTCMSCARPTARPRGPRHRPGRIADPLPQRELRDPDAFRKSASEIPAPPAGPPARG